VKLGVKKDNLASGNPAVKQPAQDSVEHDPVSRSRYNGILQFRTESGSDWI